MKQEITISRKEFQEKVGKSISEGLRKMEACAQDFRKKDADAAMSSMMAGLFHVKAVSYTHLDVYKRQAHTHPSNPGADGHLWTWRNGLPRKWGSTGRGFMRCKKCKGVFW